MKKLYLLCTALCCTTLTGCVVHDHHHRHRLPGAKVVIPVPVVVEGAAPGKHCPPGQAKKGNC